MKEGECTSEIIFIMNLFIFVSFRIYLVPLIFESNIEVIAAQNK